jgi:uncharacterized protein with FMN-binding domain
MNEDMQKPIPDEDLSSSAPSKMKSTSKSSKLFGSFAAVALFGAALVWFLGRSNRQLTLPENSKSKNANAESTLMKPSGEAQYIDGTYTAMGEYQSPAGAESINVTVTLKGNSIANVSAVGNAENPKSQHFQGLFVEGISSVVTGKPIRDVSLTVVNGSSLTPKGFMDALRKIEQEAQKS